MRLRKLTDKIYFLPHEPKLVKPMLAYIKRDKYSLSINAGYLASHVKDFYTALRACDFGKPDLKTLFLGDSTSEDFLMTTTWIKQN